MAIYIKGVELPKDGWIGLDIRINCDGTIDRHIGFGDYSLTKLQAIEVPEPHGRLIDADEFCIGLYERWETADKDGEKVISSVLADVVVPIIVSTPTVIEGSECE